ncbi:MAG TPA: glycerophosphodiester phosphodiesterase [Micrococcaceae bacterium]|nr:glycerophosphodiester phosphodiesterase [Micrococcaceae bacterium]
MSKPLPYLDSDVPVAIAHRGFSTEGLENSLPAFRAAVGLGYGYVETDVHTTSDGVALVFHDPTLDRVTDVRGSISDLTAAQVAAARINGKEPVPTLAELVTALPTVRINLDIKDDGSVLTVAEAIERYGLHDRVCVASFSDRRRRAVLRLLSRRTASSAGQTCTACFVLLGPWLPRLVMRWLLRDVDCLQVPLTFRSIRVVTAHSVARAHALGLRVHVWTINDPAIMHRLFDMGVDGLMTDRADVLAGVMRERGYWG